MLLLATACGTNEAQHSFEQAALSMPHGITEMTATGQHVDEGKPDSNDWRTAPEFSGVIKIQTPAYPNPVAYNGTFKIELFALPNNTINNLRIFIYQPQAGIMRSVSQQPFHTGLTTITLSPSQWMQGGGGVGGSSLVRVIIYDGSQNIVTYGDIKIN